MPATRLPWPWRAVVADAWVEVWQAEEGQLYGTLAAALQGREARTPGQHDPPTRLQRIAGNGCKILHRASRAPAPARPVDLSADLSAAWFARDAMKPRGTLTNQLLAEWRSAPPRRAAAKCQDSVPATVRKALLSYQELVTHMASRSRPMPPDDVDLDAFPPWTRGGAPCLVGGWQGQALSDASIRPVPCLAALRGLQRTFAAPRAGSAAIVMASIGAPLVLQRLQLG